MSEILTIIAISGSAFIGTNLDNLLLLAAFYTRYQKYTKTVAAGYIGGMLLIGAICIVIGESGEFIPITYLGLIGVVPIIMGVIALLQLFRTKHSDKMAGTAKGTSRKMIFMGVFMTQLSNGTDSIITFSVFLADSTDATDYLIILTFLAMICLFSWLAYYSLNHRKLSDILSRYGHYVTPFILILVGIYIISNTAGDLLAG